MSKEFREYNNYCNNVGLKPGRYNVTKEYLEKIENGDLVKCDVCGDYVDDQYAHKARYDNSKLVCEDCRNNGN